MAQQSGLGYKARRPPNGIDTTLSLYLWQEFSRIMRSLQGVENVQLVELNAPPDRTQTGMTVLADGTNWNPGSGQGVYTFYNSVWNKLG